MVSHNIYILDHPMFYDKNVDFLSYIKRNKPIINNMGVTISIIPILPDQLNDPKIESFLKNKNINMFPILVTENKIYKGIRDIVNIYNNNIYEYNMYLKTVEQQKHMYQLRQRQMQQEFLERENRMKLMELEKQRQNNYSQYNQQEKYAPIDDDEQIHSYIANQLQVANKNDDEDDIPFGEVGDNMMMDSYKHMINRRNVDKRSVFNNKTRTIEDRESNVIESKKIQDVIFQQLQNSNNEKTLNNRISIGNVKNDSDYEREDNIKGEIEEESINIDPSKIEHDPEDDPQDMLLEKAYWNRVSETK